MAYDIKPIEDYNGIRHTALVAESIGEIVEEYLAQLTLTTHPCRIDIATLGTPTSYALAYDVQELMTGVVTQETVSYNSDGTETVVDDIYSALKLSATDNIYVDVNLTLQDEHKYLTLVPREGYRIVSAPVELNITVDTTAEVSGNTGKACAYSGYQQITEGNYPRIIVTELPMTTVCESWRVGSVKKDIGAGETDFPFSDHYVRLNYMVKAESGSYDEIIQKGRLDAVGILRKFLQRVKEDNKHVAFCNKVSGTINRDYTVTATPVMAATEYMNGAVVNIGLDTILREIEYGGNTMLAVEILNSSVVRDEGGTQIIPVGQIIARPDYTP